MGKVTDYEFDRAMRSLARVLGVEWEDGFFKEDDSPYSFTFAGRLKRNTELFNSLQPCDTMEDEIYLLLEHLGLEIEDGKRIVKIKKGKK
jgi:hypothetical protein